jgi:hypothetical protein
MLAAAEKRIKAAEKRIKAAEKRADAEKKRADAAETAVTANLADLKLPALNPHGLESVVNKLVTDHRDLFNQPSPPSSLPLWWRLGEEYVCGELVELADDNEPHILVGLSGSGKTRTMYELLSTRFGFYWTCCVERNGGANVVAESVSNLHSNPQPANVSHAVDRLITLFCVLFLAWRRVHPNGTPLDWLVFQTTNANLSVDLAAPEKGDIDRVMSTVKDLLRPKFSSISSASFALRAVNANIGATLIVAVDEAQILGDTEEMFEEKGNVRSALSPWTRRLHFLGVAWWVTGTSLSLRHAEIVAQSLVNKRADDDTRSVVTIVPLAFDEFEAFSRHVHAVVGARLADVEASEVLQDVFDLFRGRARPVTNFAHNLRALPLTQPLTPAAVWQVALEVRDSLLDPNSKFSMVAGIKRKLKRKSHSSALGVVVKAMRMGNVEAVNCALKEHVELFQSAIGQLRLEPTSVDATLMSVECTEPLAQAALFIAFMADNPSGVRGLDPMLGASKIMPSFSRVERPERLEY